MQLVPEVGAAGIRGDNEQDLLQEGEDIPGGLHRTGARDGLPGGPQKDIFLRTSGYARDVVCTCI